MTLNKILQEAGKQLQDITKIYHGKDHACRCGCCGNYLYKGTKGFTRAINAMNKDDFDCFDVDLAVKRGSSYINIPHDYDKDKCYCVYFA